MAKRENCWGSLAPGGPEAPDIEGAGELRHLALGPRHVAPCRADLVPGPPRCSPSPMLRSLLSPEKNFGPIFSRLAPYRVKPVEPQPAIYINQKEIDFHVQHSGFDVLRARSNRARFFAGFRHRFAEGDSGRRHELLLPNHAHEGLGQVDRSAGTWSDFPQPRPLDRRHRPANAGYVRALF